MKTQATTRRSKGFNRTELLVVIGVVVLLVMVAVVLLQAVISQARRGQKINCITNLKQIAIGFRIWEGDHGDQSPTQLSVTNGGAMELALTGDVAGIFRTMSNELSSMPKVLVCPQDKQHIAATNFTTGFSSANISYFVTLDAGDSYPQMTLAGDDNLVVNGKPVQPGILNLVTNATVGWTMERHHGAGYVAFFDGSVAQINSATLQQAFQPTVTATNRLVIP